ARCTTPPGTLMSTLSPLQCTWPTWCCGRLPWPRASITWSYGSNRPPSALDCLFRWPPPPSCSGLYWFAQPHSATSRGKSGARPALSRNCKADLLLEIAKPECPPSLAPRASEREEQGTLSGHLLARSHHW